MKTLLQKQWTSIFTAIFAVLITSCSNQTTISYGEFETKVIASQMNELYIIRAQGKGATKQLAEQQAVKQAVHDVIFKKIYLTYSDHNILFPLIADPRIETMNQPFFSAFFAEGGTYLKFVKPTSDKKKKYQTDVLKSCIMNVCVDRGALKDYLKTEGF